MNICEAMTVTTCKPSGWWGSKTLFYCKWDYKEMNWIYCFKKWKKEKGKRKRKNRRKERKGKRRRINVQI
jgi:hypothetical protein